MGFKPKTPADCFTINQKIGMRMTRRWEVTLDQYQAIFSGRDGSERFVTNRQKIRPKFQFNRSGFLLFSEDTSAFVRTGENF